MSARGGLTADQANAIYDVLVAHAGAREPDRAEFVHHQTDRFCPEYRFMGSLGFGGKFWRNSGRRSYDGTWGEVWYVTAYGEDVASHPERVDVLEATNDALAPLRAAADAAEAMS